MSKIWDSNTDIITDSDMDNEFNWWDTDFGEVGHGVPSVTDNVVFSPFPQASGSIVAPTSGTLICNDIFMQGAGLGGGSVTIAGVNNNGNSLEDDPNTTLSGLNISNTAIIAAGPIAGVGLYQAPYVSGNTITIHTGSLTIASTEASQGEISSNVFICASAIIYTNDCSFEANVCNCDVSDQNGDNFVAHVDGNTFNGNYSALYMSADNFFENTFGPNGSITPPNSQTFYATKGSGGGSGLGAPAFAPAGAAA